VEAAHALALLSSGATLVVADLGCSSGLNTLLVVSEVLGALAGRRRRCQVQFFLNDLPSNDFNQVFRSLELFNDNNNNRKGEKAPPYYVAGVPGSFYTRLFPDRSVHLFYSSFCLMIRSKVPEGVGSLNQGNIYLWETTPAPVVELYQEQFREDLSQFLRLRHSELVASGRMVLTFVGRKDAHVLRGEMCCFWGLLSQALQALVHQGRVEKEKLDSFNLPLYTPSIAEVEAAIEESQLFDINHIRLSEHGWDDLDGDVVLDTVQSGVKVARNVRPVMGPILARHFGEGILDDLFETFAQNVAKHLERVVTQEVDTKYAVVLLSLTARCAVMPDIVTSV